MTDLYAQTLALDLTLCAHGAETAESDHRHAGHQIRWAPLAAMTIILATVVYALSEGGLVAALIAVLLAVSPIVTVLLIAVWDRAEAAAKANGVQTANPRANVIVLNRTPAAGAGRASRGGDQPAPLPGT